MLYVQDFFYSFFPQFPMPAGYVAKKGNRGGPLIQVYTNFEIGRRIVEHEQQGAERAEYGKKIFKELATELTDEFGNDFSKSNLEYMRRFYLLYQGRKYEIAQTLSGQLPTASEIPQTASGESVLPAKLQMQSAQFILPDKEVLRQKLVEWSADAKLLAGGATF